MKSSKDMQLIYDYLIDNDSIPAKKLNEIGYNAKDINNLIEDKRLNRITRGHYQLVGVDELYYYGRYLVTKRNFTRSEQCFNKCYQMNPEHPGVCFQLFIRAVDNMKCDDAFKYLDGFYNQRDEHNIKNASYYLYLLSNITPLPEKYQNYINNLKYDDIRISIDDKRFANIDMQNKIRLAAYNHKFPYAYSMLKKLIEKDGKVEVSNIIARSLLFQVLQIETKSKDALLEYINNKNYYGIIDFFEAKTKLHSLNIIDQYTLILTKKIVTIMEEKTILNKVNERSKNIFDAIDAGDYQLALEYSNAYNLENNINNSKSVIYCLLNDIVELINNIKISEQEELKNKEENQLAVDATVTTEKQSYTLELFKIDTDVVVQCLINKDYPALIAVLRQYLTSINKMQYEFFIHDLIKISLCEGDLDFTNPIRALTYISNGEIEFDISYFLQVFYENLSANGFEMARVYLDILSNINNFGISNIYTSNLEKALVISERALDTKQDYEIIKMFSQAIDESNNIQIVINAPEEIKIPTTDDSVSINNDVVDRAISNKLSNIEKLKRAADMNVESIKKYVDEAISKVIESEDLIILNPMSSESRKIVRDIIANRLDIIGFNIGDESNRRLVLRYMNPSKEFVNFKQILVDYKTNFMSENYVECIDKMKYIMHNVKYTKSFVFYNLGICYSKLHDKKNAIKYLTVYQELEKGNADFRKDVSDFIAILKGEVDKDNYKPFFRMSVDEFKNNPDTEYYIDHIDDIKEKVLYSGEKIEDACRKLEVGNENVPLVKLIIAKELYSLGKDYFADKIVKEVEKEKNKNVAVKHMLDEIIRSKKFYKNRKGSEDTPRLILSR
jgi:hypothetical protein